jgi:predicted unusual protein kinase regulating ubiquinone biosynthesis (AarF/ABC1/UbiB family)
VDDKKPPTEDEAKKMIQEPARLAKEMIDSWKNGFRDSIGKLLGDLKVDFTKVKQEASDSRTAGARLLFQAATATPRAKRIATEATILFGSYRFTGMRTRGLSREAVEAERAATDRRVAARVANACMELRGGVLKLGQFASTRRDLLSPAWIQALSRLQDSVPPLPFAEIRARVEQELGAPIAERFASFDEAPLAAASLAQVHAATLPDGTRVAVKVQVPGVEDLIDADILLFQLLDQTARELWKGLDTGAIVNEVARSVREELDYRIEAQNARDVAAAVAAEPSLRVPRSFPELSTARVLTMERIDGRRLTDYLDACAARGDEGAADRDRVLTALVRAYAIQILSLGRFQADPHPGNFLVCDDGVLALLDFGALHTLEPEQRAGYVALTAAVIGRDRERAGVELDALGFAVRDGGDPAALVDMAGLLLDAFRPAPDTPLDRIDPGAAFDEALALARRSRISVPDHFVQLGRALAALAGLLLAYKPKVDLFGLVAPYLTAPPLS